MRSWAKRNASLLWFAGLGVFSTSCDQATKHWARTSLPTPRVVIDGFWDFRFVENPGTAFSLIRNLGDARYFAVVIGLIALVWVGLTVRKNLDRPWACAALGLIAGGALGNLYDRAVHGRVTDFVHWHVRNFSWPIFNIADVVLFLGVVMMLVMPKRPAAQA